MKNSPLLLIASIQMLNFQSIIHAQSDPLWFGETGVYRNWISREKMADFDVQIPTAGVPAWGLWFTLSMGEDALREEISTYHTMGKFYVASLTYTNIARPDTVYYPVDSVAARDIHGRIILPQDRVATSLCSPMWRHALADYMKRIVDAGADGILFDDMGADMTSLFDRYSMKVFRKYLKSRYTAGELQSRFGITDIDHFNYLALIASRGELETWQNQALTGLKEEFWIFKILTERGVLKELSDSTKAYALENYGKNITISCNIFYAGSSEFDIYLDLVDYPVGELHFFGKNFQSGKFGPTFSTGYEVHDYTALTNKIRRSVRDWPVLPLNEPEGYSYFNYPSRTRDLIRLMFADAYASQGSMLLNPNFDCFDFDHILFNAVEYDYTTAGQYAGFILNNPSLFNNRSFQPRTCILYSMSSLNLKSFFEAGGLPIVSFYGAGQFLIDHSIPFDVIFAPEIRFSTIPDITVEKIESYETLILPNTTNLNDHQADVILEYVQNGGTAIALGDIGKNGEEGRPVSRPTLEGLQINGVKVYGLGKFVFYKELRAFGYEYGSFYWAFPEDTDQEFMDFISPYIQPEMKLSGPDSTSGFLYHNGDMQYSVHLVNYAYDIPTDQLCTRRQIQIDVQADTTRSWDAVFVSPDTYGPQVLDVSVEGGYVCTTVPSLDAYGILLLQENTDAPVVLSRIPEKDTTLIAGESLALSVLTEDPDRNALFFQWFVNGIPDTLATGDRYTYQTFRTSSGMDTLTVEITDGRHDVTEQWILTIQAYNTPKILFDESHQERNTLSMQRANILNPEHPDWIHFGTLREETESDYVMESIETGPLNAQALKGWNVLLLSAPELSLSASEISDIVAFVSDGGGLLFLGDAGLNPEINSLLGCFGIQFDNTLICEPVTSGDPGNPVISVFNTHESLGSDPGFQMNWGGSFNITALAAALGFTSFETWCDTDWNLIPGGNEQKGPFCVMAAAEFGQGRVFCISDNPFNDSFLTWEACPNDDLILNVLEWLTHNVNRVSVAASTTTGVLGAFELSMNFPNPFNPGTTIQFSISSPEQVSVKIYDILGEEVITLTDRPYGAGSYRIFWDGIDRFGVQAGSGLYLICMECGECRSIKKCILCK